MSASKVSSQTVKWGECGPSEWTEGADELSGAFERAMLSDSFSAAASEKEQIYQRAMLKQPVVKLHRIGMCFHVTDLYTL